jgi:transcriptional regulator with XRE-family HTH domain
MTHQDNPNASFLSCLGKRIHDLRIEHRLTRRNLGSHVGLSVHQLNQFETGQLDLEILTFLKISERLEMEPSDLVAACDGSIAYLPRTELQNATNSDIR